MGDTIMRCSPSLSSSIWLYDKDMVHCTKTNKDSFGKDGKKLISQLLNKEVTYTTKTTPTRC